MSEIHNLDWSELLKTLEGFASSEAAKHKLRHLEPLGSPDEALQSFEEIEEAQALIAAGQRPSQESLDIFNPWIERLKKQAVLKVLEIKDVRRFCWDALRLKELAESVNSPWFVQLHRHILDAREPLAAIDHIITLGGDIRTDASETLSDLFESKKHKERELHGILGKLVKAHNLESVLQDKFVTTREGRWVLPIKSGKQHNFEGIIHDASQSKQTVFMEPQEAVSINNEIRGLDIKIEKEVERILTELSRYLSTLTTQFAQSRDALEKADIRFAQSQLTHQLGSHSVQFETDEVLLRGLRHPVLALQNPSVVPNDVELDSSKRILLLSGPNAGGKTVLLKAVGLAAQMARCGLPICADIGSKLPFFRKIYLAVGDEQSVHKNLSTFAAHLTALTEATKVKGSSHLLLIDEICGATDPEEGSALAKSFIEYYDKNKIKGIITSHLGALKEGWTKESGVLNGRLEFDEIEGRATYKLFLGLPGQSQALKTAKIIGVPDSIVDRALELMHPDVRNRKKKLDELEAIKNEMIQAKSRLEEEQKKTADLKDKYLVLVEKFKKERDVWMAKAVKMAESKIQELIEAARTQHQNLKALGAIKDQLPTLIKSPQAKPTIQSPEDFANAFPPGSPIFVLSIQQEGVIQSPPDTKGMLTVLSQSMRLQVHWKDLQVSRSTPKISVVRPEGSKHLGPAEERTVDLRGTRVDEALRELESQLDLAMRNKEDRLKVIHGHGTEALKKSVRTFLSRSVYVSKWKSGDLSSGGDGVTWVELSG